MSIVDSSTANTALSVGDTMTSGGGTHTKGAWDEAIASTSEETYWLHLVLKCPSTVSDESFLIDIGVGAPSSEVVQINNIPFFANVLGTMEISMPITIASGARVAIRCQSTAATIALEYMVYLSNDDSLGTSTSNETLGADTGASKGEDIDPGGIDNVKGSYAELTASTGINSGYLIVICGNSDNSGQTNQDYLYDIATGPATETVIIGNVPFSSSATEAVSANYSFFQSVASGTRLSARVQSSAAAAAGASDRLIDIVVLAFNITPPAGGGGIAQIVGQGGIVG